ncbi:hypothetical protein Tco_1173700 [Tanacetum coccineum]
MLYYLTIRRKFNFTSMIIYLLEEVINKHDGPMPFAMLLTHLYNHILQTNPQTIVPIARFTFHERVMDPLDISRDPSKEKGKKIASPSGTSSSSSSSDDNEVPSFLEFYDGLSDNEDLTKAQREKRGMFKCLNCYARTITNSGGLCWKMRPTDPPYGRSVRCFGGSMAHQSRRQNSNFLDF